jgi:two-component system response regulator HydG
MKKRVLIIDDDFDMCSLLSKFLVRKGYETETAHSGAKGIARFKEDRFDIVLCDFRLGDMDGKRVLAEIKAISPQAIVLIITGYSDIKTAVDVIRLGAFDYITKPLIPDEVITVLEKAVTQAKEQISNSAPENNTGSASRIMSGEGNTGKGEFLIGKAATTTDLYKQIEIIAPTNYSVILYGESGTGKEVIAKTIHHLSSRAGKPFVALDCGTLSKELSGSELFGHMKGAFTGALADKEGHFELANGGTLFLDEVSNLSVEIQASLLRVIQERKFKRVGGTKEMPVDVRIIVASNENLQDAYRKGNFREDLYHRFNEFSINLPPLRSRKEDIPLFANFFLDKTISELEKTGVTGFEEEVMEMFLHYNWPGNLREFRNVVRRCVLLTTTGMVSASTLPWEITHHSNGTAIPAGNVINGAIQNDIANPAAATDFKNISSKAEYEAILQTLQKVNFNKTKAAEMLNIDRKTLYNKIKNYEELYSKATGQL